MLYENSIGCPESYYIYRYGLCFCPSPFFGVFLNRKSRILAIKKEGFGGWLLHPMHERAWLVYLLKVHKPCATQSAKSPLLLTLLTRPLAHVHTCFSAISDYSMKYLIEKKINCVFTPHGKLSPAMYKDKKLLKDVYFQFI